MFRTSAKEEARRRLKVEQQLEMLKDQERRKKEREAIRATWPWWRKQPILITFLCLCVIYVLGDSSDIKKAATPAATPAIATSAAVPAAKTAAVAEAKEQIDTIRSETTGVKAVMSDFSLGCLSQEELGRLHGLDAHDPDTVISAIRKGICANIYRGARIWVIDNKSSSHYTLVRPEAGKGARYWIPSSLPVTCTQFSEKHGWCAWNDSLDGLSGRREVLEH